MSRQAGKGKLGLSMDKIDKKNAREPEAPETKTGLEIVRERFQAHSDADEEDRVRVVDHDSGRTLWSGTEEDYELLVQAIEEEG